MEKDKTVEKAIEVVSEKENNILNDFLYALIVTLYLLLFVSTNKLKVNVFIKISIGLTFIACGYFLPRLLRKIKEKTNKYLNRNDREYILAKKIVKLYQENKIEQRNKEKIRLGLLEKEKKEENIKEFEKFLEKNNNEVKNENEWDRRKS